MGLKLFFLLCILFYVNIFFNDNYVCFGFFNCYWENVERISGFWYLIENFFEE